MRLKLTAVIFSGFLLVPARAASSDELGQTIREGIGRERTLISSQNGWNVYRAKSVESNSCFAYKIAEKEKGDAIHSGTLMSSGMMWGSRGVKMWIPDKEKSYSQIKGIRLGFFGNESHWHSDVVQIGDKIFRNVKIPRDTDISIETFLEADGKVIPFEVTSSEYDYLIGDTDFFQGELSLTGFRQAYTELLKCHADNTQ